MFGLTHVTPVNLINKYCLKIIAHAGCKSLLYSRAQGLAPESARYIFDEWGVDALSEGKRLHNSQPPFQEAESSPETQCHRLDPPRARS